MQISHPCKNLVNWFYFDSKWFSDTMIGSDARGDDDVANQFDSLENGNLRER